MPYRKELLKEIIMSRQTVTITARNGSKVRTVASKRYFVVYATVWANGERPVEVVRRTDSAVAAQAMMRKSSFHTVYALTIKDREAGTLTTRELTDTEVHNRAFSEVQQKSFAARVGNNGPARSLAY
jgi:hypothetical protein